MSNLRHDLLGKSESGVILLCETALTFDREKERQIELKYQDFKDMIYYSLDSKETAKIDGKEILILKCVNYFNSGGSIRDYPLIDIMIRHKEIPKEIITPDYFVPLTKIHSSIRNILRQNSGNSKEIHRNLKRFAGKGIIESARHSKKAGMQDFFDFALERMPVNAKTMFLLSNCNEADFCTDEIKYITEKLGKEIINTIVPEPINDHRVFVYQPLYVGSPYVRTGNRQMLTKAREEEIDMALFFPSDKSEMPNPIHFDRFMENLYNSSLVYIQTGSKIPVYRKPKNTEELKYNL